MGLILGQAKRPLFIDPGYAVKGKGCALASFSAGRLLDAWFDRPEEFTRHLARCVDLVVWEKPQADGRTYDCGPETVIELAAQGGVLAGLYGGAAGCPVEAVLPGEWKGSARKPQHHLAMWGALSHEERALLGGDATLAAINSAVDKGASCNWDPRRRPWYPESWLTHNLLDATGMGLWYDGRFQCKSSSSGARKNFNLSRPRARKLSP